MNYIYYILKKKKKVFPYPHPQCGNTNPAYGIFVFITFDDSNGLYKKDHKIANNISAASAFWENQYTTHHVFYGQVMFFLNANIRCFVILFGYCLIVYMLKTCSTHA